MNRLKEDSVILEKFLKDVTINFTDINARDIGHVDYAPKTRIDVRVDEYKYTRDMATFQLEATIFKANFKGNVVDLGACCFIFSLFFVSLCRLIKIFDRQDIYCSGTQRDVLGE